MIKEDGVVIRTIEKKDLKVLKLWNNQDARGLYQEFQFSSFTNLEKDFEHNGFDTEKMKMLIVEVEEEEPIGLLYLNFLRDGLARIGLVICDNQFRNNNYGSKITRLIVEHLFDNYPLVRIEAETDTENLAAQKVLEKAGFTKEGVLRKYRYHHKAWRDFVLYSTLINDL